MSETVRDLEVRAEIEWTQCGTATFYIDPTDYHAWLRGEDTPAKRVEFVEAGRYADDAIADACDGISWDTTDLHIAGPSLAAASRQVEDNAEEATNDE